MYTLSTFRSNNTQYDQFTAQSFLYSKSSMKILYKHDCPYLMSSSSSSSVESVNATLHGFFQSSPPMQMHASVHGMSLYLQAQMWFRWHADFWPPHLVNSNSPTGAGLHLFLPSRLECYLGSSHGLRQNHA